MWFLYGPGEPGRYLARQTMVKRLKGLALSIFGVFVLLTIVAWAPVFYHETETFNLTTVAPASPMIGGAPMRVSIQPTTSKYQWFIISCTERKSPYVLKIMASPKPGEIGDAEEFQISSVMIRHDTLEAIDLITDAIATHTLTKYHWGNAVEIAIPEFEFHDGMTTQVVVGLQDKAGKNQQVKLFFSGKRQIGRASLGMQ